MSFFFENVDYNTNVLKIINVATYVALNVNQNYNHQKRLPRKWKLKKTDI